LVRLNGGMRGASASLFRHILPIEASPSYPNQLCRLWEVVAYKWFICGWPVRRIHSQRIRTATQFQLGIYEAPVRGFTIQPKCDRFKNLNHAVFIVLSAVYPRINVSEYGSPGSRWSLIALETTQPNFLRRRLCSYDSCHHNLRIIAGLLVRLLFRTFHIRSPGSVFFRSSAIHSSSRIFENVFATSLIAMSLSFSNVASDLLSRKNFAPIMVPQSFLACSLLPRQDFVTVLLEACVGTQLCFSR
jgi:hypothetical protein